MSNSTRPRILNETGLKIAEALEAIAAGLGGEGWVSGSKENERNPVKVNLKDETGLRIAAALEAIGASLSGNDRRVTSLDNTELAGGNIIEAVGVPTYVEDPAMFPEFAITESGWYLFARIAARKGADATAATVEGADAYNLASDHIDVAVRFEVAALSKSIRIDWGEITETFVFKATDLAVYALDYRVTFYVYDIEDKERNFAHWEYAITTDTTFSADKRYYTKNADDSYTRAEVTTGEAVPADTYYTHTKVTFEGMARNITYVCNTPIDCPVTFNLPVIEDATHGAWFEIRFLHLGSFSSTLVTPEGVKVATEHTQPETKGFNTVDLHYSAIDDVKMWRFLNTHSSIPA